jgi:hypothetical protein
MRLAKVASASAELRSPHDAAKAAITFATPHKAAPLARFPPQFRCEWQRLAQTTFTLPTTPAAEKILSQQEGKLCLEQFKISHVPANNTIDQERHVRRVCRFARK